MLNRTPDFLIPCLCIGISNPSGCHVHIREYARIKGIIKQENLKGARVTSPVVQNSISISPLPLFPRSEYLVHSSLHLYQLPHNKYMHIWLHILCIGMLCFRNQCKAIFGAVSRLVCASTCASKRYFVDIGIRSVHWHWNFPPLVQACDKIVWLIEAEWRIYASVNYPSLVQIMLPGRRQAIIRTNVGMLLIGPSGTNFSEILIVTQIFSIKEM